MKKYYEIIAGLCFIGFGPDLMGQSNTFPTSGNVGVGTTSPTVKLEVVGSVRGNDYIFPLQMYDMSLGPRTQLSSMSVKLFDDHVTYRPGGTAPGNNNYGNVLAMYGRSGHWQSDLYFGGSDKRMYYRIGVYTTHPSDNGPGGFMNWRAVLDSGSDLQSSGKLLISGTGYHYIKNGNVGIGFENPTERLSVNGNIRAREIKVESVNWPDYVFKENYELRSLKELNNYIAEHGHLPDVPSAAEIQRDGLSLGEMDKVLLKKIEELTLYLIERDKKIKELELQVQKLNSLNE